MFAKTFRIGGDLEVNRLGYGSMRITGPGIWGEPRDAAEARRVLKRLPELGVNFIDTADSYGPDVSERLIGETLAPYTGGTVVATKAGLTRQGPDKWLPVGRPEYLEQQVLMSLRRLRTDTIELWQLHRIDSEVPIEESLGVIARLKKEGKIKHVGPERGEACGNRAGSQGGGNRQRSESLQRRQPRARRCRRLLRGARARVHTMVSGGRREIGATRRHAGLHRQATRCNRSTALHSVAVAS